MLLEQFCFSGSVQLFVHVCSLFGWQYHTCGCHANWATTVAVRPLSGLVHTGHAELEGATWWQVCDIVVAVGNSGGYS